MGMGEHENSGVSVLGRTVRIQGLKPRAVLGLLLGASLAGIWIANTADPVLVRVLSWLTLVTVGGLVGGLYWRLALFDHSGFTDDDTYRTVKRRWRRIETIAALGFALAGGVYLRVAVRDGPLGIGHGALGIGVVSALVLWVCIRWLADAQPANWKKSVRAALLLAALASIAGFAWLETGTTLLDWGVRLAHVGAVSLWLGGAIWHNFVVLPSVRSSPEAGKMMKPQARAFRRHLPIVIPVVFVTGVSQTHGLIGLSAPALLGSRIGHLIGFKLFVLVVLTAFVATGFKRNA
jgi:hypothetical protein